MHPLARIAVVAGIAACWAAPLSAQWSNARTASATPNLKGPAPKLTDGKTPDLSGIWAADKEPCDEAKASLGCIDAQGGIPVGFINIDGAIGAALPMQPWAEAVVKQRMADGAKNDPASKCLPFSPPRAWASFFYQKIIQTRESVTILDEYMLQYRQIFVDGRKLPDNPEPLFKGYSVGKWEGETLVVETAGLKDGGWLDLFGHPLTDQARVIERIRRINVGSLEVQMTINDPKAYTKPWSATRHLSLAPNMELLEYVCNENEKSLQHMVGADAK